MLSTRDLQWPQWAEKQIDYFHYHLSAILVFPGLLLVLWSQLIEEILITVFHLHGSQSLFEYDGSHVSISVTLSGTSLTLFLLFEASAGSQEHILPETP